MSQSILGDDQKALELNELLQALQSPDNVQRSSAEERLASRWINEQPAALFLGLAEQVQRAEEQATRAFAAVLFRRMSTKSIKETGADASVDLFISTDPQVQEASANKLLECLTQEKNDSVRDKIGDAVAEVARQYSDKGRTRAKQLQSLRADHFRKGHNWVDLLNALSQLSQSGEAGQRVTAYRVFATTPDIIEKEHEQAVIGAFTKGFEDPDTHVRLAAVDAYASFFQLLAKNSQKKYFPLIGKILAILPPVKESKDDELLSQALLALIELAEVQPKMFKDHFHDLVSFSVSVIQDSELEDTPRQNALELMATFADQHPAMCRKDPSYTTEMVKQCLALMTDVGGDDDNAEIWKEAEDMDADESDENHVAGEQTMDRLANKLGGQVLVRPVFEWLPRMLVSQNWREKHAALMAISAISEGCRDIMENELLRILELITPTLADPHPRVRWAGCNALGQMSTDFATTMQEKYAQIVVPNLIRVLEAPEARVQSHAAAALVNFCEEAQKEVLEPFLDELLTKLHSLLQKPERFVQEQALSTIATVADSAQTAFSHYYNVLMPLMFTALQQPQDKDSRLLKAKAMECATLIALAVGREKMGSDALALMQLLDTIQSSISEADDPQASYLLHSWRRMCQVMGADFVSYLPRVIPPLMQLASAKADIQLLDDEEEVAKIEGEEGWELVPVKGKFIGINTATLDDKHTAIELIFTYAQTLAAAFEPYVMEIMDGVTLPSLAFFFHDPVRVAAAKAIPQLLNSYKQKHGLQSPQMQALWVRTIDKVLEVLSTEPAIDTLAEMYQCFYESLEVMGANCLTEIHMKRFIESAESVLKDYQERVRMRQEDKAEQGPEDDEEDSEEELMAIEDDQTLLSDMNKAFHIAMKQQKQTFLPCWESLLGYYQEFVTSTDPTQRQWALCLLDDVLEFCGAESFKYRETIAPALSQGMQDENASNRQAACYGVGVLAQNGTDSWSPFAAQSLPALFNAVKVPQARDDEHVYATENACAAIAKILRSSYSKVPNPEEVTAAWLDTLPVTNDEEAAPYAYGFLGQLVENKFQPAMQKAQWLFKCTAEALAAETLQGKQADAAVHTLRALSEAAGVDAMRQVVEQLPAETQAVIQKMMQG